MTRSTQWQFTDARLRCQLCQQSVFCRWAARVQKGMHMIFYSFTELSCFYLGLVIKQLTFLPYLCAHYRLPVLPVIMSYYLEASTRSVLRAARCLRPIAWLLPTRWLPALLPSLTEIPCKCMIGHLRLVSASYGTALLASFHVAYNIPSNEYDSIKSQGQPDARLWHQLSK